MMSKLRTFRDRWDMAKERTGERGAQSNATIRPTRADEGMTREAQDALGWSPLVPANVRVAVYQCRVILSGEVRWQYQRAAAERVVRRLRGLAGITNHIRVRGQTPVSGGGFSDAGLPDFRRVSGASPDSARRRATLACDWRPTEHGSGRPWNTFEATEARAARRR
jgi:hypothetical protein